MSWRALKRFCDGPPEYGLNVPASEYMSGGLRFLRTTDIGKDGTLATANEAVYVDPAQVVDERHRLRSGDLLFSRSGTLGRCLRYAREHGPATYAGYLVRFRTRSEVDPRFLQYCAQSQFFQDAIAADAITSTISNFNAEKYAGLQVPWQEPLQQRAIADYLDTETARIDSLITKKRRMIELLDERRAGAMLAGVAGELTTSGPTSESGLPWLSKIPQHWGSPKIAYAAKLGSGHTPSRSRPEWWVPEECTVPWITTGGGGGPSVGSLRVHRPHKRVG